MRRHLTVATLVTASLVTVAYQHVISQAKPSSLTGMSRLRQGSMEGPLTPGRYQLSSRAKVTGSKIPVPPR